MLKRISAFVLEILPYLLTTVIAAVVIPGFVYAQIHQTSAAVTPSVSGSREKVVAVLRWSDDEFALLQLQLDKQPNTRPSVPLHR